MSEARHWHGRQNDEDFWHAVAELACVLKGEPAADRRARIEHFLRHFPEPCPEAMAENFRRDAVRQLLATWAVGPIETENRAWIERLFAALEGQLQELQCSQPQGRA